MSVKNPITKNGVEKNMKIFKIGSIKGYINENTVSITDINSGERIITDKDTLRKILDQ